MLSISTPAILIAVLAIVNFLIFPFLYLRKKRDPLMSLSLFLFNSGVGSWQIVLIYNNNFNDSLLGHKAAFVIGSLLIWGLLGLAFAYPNRKIEKIRKMIFLACGLVMLSNVALILGSDLVIRDYLVTEKEVVFGPWQLLLLVPWAMGLIGSAVLFAYRYIKEIFERYYFKYVFVAFIIYVPLAIVINFIFPILGITEYTLIGSLLAIFPQAAIVYTVAADRLHTLRYLIEKGASGVVSAGLLWLGLIIFEVAAGNFKLTELVANGLLGKTLLFSFLFIVLLKAFGVYLRDPILHFLFHSLRDPKNTLKAFSAKIATVLELEKLIKEFTNMLSELFSPEFIVSLIGSGDGEVRYSDASILNIERNDLQKIWRTLSNFQFNHVYNFSELSRIARVKSLDDTQANLLRLLEEMKVQLVLITGVGDSPNGMFLLGHKSDRAPYTVQDIELIESLSINVSHAFAHGLLHIEVQQFNSKLQQEIDKATSDLRETNKELQNLDRMKDELVSIASHELRTPMTIIKSYLWMALNKFGLVMDPKLKDYLERAFESSERMIHLVNDMLSASRLEGKQMELNLNEQSLIEMIEEVATELDHEARKKDIKIIFHQPSGEFPKVLADHERLFEILTNVIGNAVKYTDKGSIKITIKESSQREPNALEQDSKYVWVTTEDTGRGIVQEDLPRLFKKFGRLEVGDFSRMAESQGTGLGLYITKGLVELHGGAIWVESEKGKGSRFTFSLKASG